MRRQLKIAESVMAVSITAVALGGCSGAAEPNTYGIALADAKARIGSTQSEYKTGSQTRTMRPAGPSENGVRVRLSHAGTFASSCYVRFEEVDAQTTRIIPDCGETQSTTGDVAAKYFEMEIAQHIRQMLTGVPVDAEALGKQMAMLTLKNAPGIAKEGGQPNEGWVEEQTNAAIDRVNKEQDGWGDDAAADPSDGGWGD